MSENIEKLNENSAGIDWKQKRLDRIEKHAKEANPRSEQSDQSFLWFEYSRLKAENSTLKAQLGEMEKIVEGVLTTPISAFENLSPLAYLQLHQEKEAIDYALAVFRRMGIFKIESLEKKGEGE